MGSYLVNNAWLDNISINVSLLDDGNSDSGGGIPKDNINMGGSSGGGNSTSLSLPDLNTGNKNSNSGANISSGGDSLNESNNENNTNSGVSIDSDNDTVVKDSPDNTENSSTLNGETFYENEESLNSAAEEYPYAWISDVQKFRHEQKHYY